MSVRRRAELAVIVALACTVGINRAGGASPGIGGYNVYYGQLHSHTSISDGSGTPDQAYKYARDTAKLDFFSIADHCSYPYDSMMTAAEYEGIQATANSFNQDGTYVTFWGFEWTSDDTSWGGPSTLLGKGHLTVVNSPDFCRATDEASNDLNELANWMSTRNVVAFFNHPGQYNTTFDNFNFNYSEKIVGMELWNRSSDYYGSGSWYHSALNKGFHIGATGSGDNHSANWGTQNEWRMAVLAPEKTRAAIYAAMQARRFYSSRDKNLALSFKCNGAQMGSKIAGGALNIEIEAFDQDNRTFTKIDLLKNGSVLQTWNTNAPHPQASTSLNGTQGDYYYVRVYTGSTAWAAISSPIFITNIPPLDTTPPTARFNALPTNGFAPLIVRFTDNSAAGGGSIASRCWNFGDGMSTNTSGTNLTHNYTGAGNYSARLTVTNSGGLAGSATGTIAVAAVLRPTYNPLGAISVGLSGLCALTIVAINGVKYRIVCKTDLLDTNAWAPLTNGWTSGSNSGPITIIHQNATNSPQFFYRIEAESKDAAP